MSKAMVACPSNRGTAALTIAPIIESLLATCAALKAVGFEVVDPTPTLMTGCSEISLARATILRVFLDSGADTLLSFDDDESWPASDAVALVKTITGGYDCDFLSGVYPIKRFDPNRLKAAAQMGLDGRELSEYSSMGPCVTLMPGKEGFEYEGHKFVRCSHVGAGALCVSRSMVLKMIVAYPDLSCTANGLPQKFPALFLPMIYKGEYLTDDMAFCQRWTDIGGEIYAMTTSRFVHYGSFPFRIALDERLKESK